MSHAFVVVLVTLELQFWPSGDNLSPAVVGVNPASELPARTSRDNMSPAVAFAVTMEQPVASWSTFSRSADSLSSLPALGAWAWHVLSAEVCGVTKSRG